MNDVKITVGGEMESAASACFINAWHRAERGETFHERHLAFENWDTLSISTPTVIFTSFMRYLVQSAHPPGNRSMVLNTWDVFH